MEECFDIEEACMSDCLGCFEKYIHTQNENIPETILTILVIKNSKKCLKRLLELKNIDIYIPKDYLGDTYLHLCVCNSSRYDVLEVLLEHGFDPNLQNKMGNTPLHNAAYYQEIKYVKLLLKYGGDPKIKNKINQTPENISSRLFS
jgi:ankyrin repeat protein